MMIGKKARNYNLLNYGLRKIFVSSPKSKQGGFTIVESLMAIVVVSILLAAIAPVIALSVANRVQAKRIESASQAARSYIDGVRIGTISSPLAPATKTELKDYGPPASSRSFNCPTNSYCTDSGAVSTTATKLYCIDFDGDGNCKHTSNKDMVIQAFRDTDSSLTGYALGIRVYRADAFNGATLNKGAQQNSFTGGIGRKDIPLVEMTTEINNVVPKYGELCNRIGCGTP
jgi:prepilin-type N-terminal cleavage/methylation domain-containing protein